MSVVRIAACLTSTVLVAACGSGGGGDTGSSRPADRTVTVTATDTLRFEPETIAARPGETIEFVITNSGRAAHEFTIGSDDYQAKHEPSGGHGGGHAESSEEGASVPVPAGKTARLTFTMPDQAPSYQCHVDDHDKAGMKGRIVYSG